MIFRIRNPKYPQYLFEFHEESQKVYCIDLAKTTVRDGQTCHSTLVIGEHCDTHGRAYGFVQAFCRGHAIAEKDYSQSIIQ